MRYTNGIYLMWFKAHCIHKNNMKIRVNFISTVTLSKKRKEKSINNHHIQITQTHRMKEEREREKNAKSKYGNNKNAMEMAEVFYMYVPFVPFPSCV